MNRRLAGVIYALSIMFAGSAAVADDTTAKAGLINPGFEEPLGNKDGVTFFKTIPGWKTTDTEFEIWPTGFEGFKAHGGAQFVELNAHIDGTLYQDSNGIKQGAALEFTFAHRGRNGKDTMKLTITDLGKDNSLGGGDDTVLFTKEYSTGKEAWAVYDSTTEKKLVALGNTVQFAYTAVFGTGGKGPNKSEGNFLDDADFGVGVVSTKRDSFVNSIDMKFKLIPAGTFMMGSPVSEQGRTADEVQHEVTITRAYYLGITEVTQSQWQKVMGTTPWKGKAIAKEGADFPAEYISWNNADEFCRKLSKQEGRTYRLPTEAEWEYACRAGTKTQFSFGNDVSEFGGYAWYLASGNSAVDGYVREVGKKKTNGFGLYDMHGNVWEHCQDPFGAYPKGNVTDPTGPASGASHVIRGGGWGQTNPADCRSASRSSIGDPDRLAAAQGLRVVLVPEGASVANQSTDSTILDVPTYAQQTGMWCWATGGEMIMKYHGVSVAQCKQANDYYPKEYKEQFTDLKIDCCGFLTDGTAVDERIVLGGWPQLADYGFTSTLKSDSPLTFEEIKAQIDAKQPIGFSWSWKSGGGHYMVLTGYKTIAGVPMIKINDPGPFNVDKLSSPTDHTRWMTYAYWCESEEHTHGTDEYDIKKKQ